MNLVLYVKEMYQRNLGRNSLSESIVSNRSIEKKKKSTSSLNRAPSLDSLGNPSSSAGSMSDNGNKPMDNGSGSIRRESVKMDYNNMETYQELHDPRSASGDDCISDVDSIEDPQESRVTTTQVQIHTKTAHLEFDDEDVVDQSEIPNDPVVTAYLEKASHICQNNCVKSMTQFNTRNEEGISVEDANEEDAIVPNGHLLSVSTTGSVKNRRTSLSSGSVGRMETIVEEPIEAKVSVKEILARFETLRESAEVNALPLISMIGYSVYGRTG